MSPAPRLLDRNHRLPAAVALFALFGAVFAASSAAAPAAAQPSLIAYAMTGQWPERAAAAVGLLQSPVDLDVAPDGTVLVADRGIGGVHRLLPSGAFTAPFGTSGGFPGQLGQVGPLAIGPGLSEDDTPRVYVLDTAVDRVVVYSLDGAFLAHWEGIAAASIAAAPDGRVFVLDREASAVRALDAATGAEVFRFGERGTGEGQFANFVDVDVTEDGRVLAVADLGGLRVRLFGLADAAGIASGAAPATLRDAHDLTESRYNKTDATCRGQRVNALGGDRLLIGQGEQACLVEGNQVTAAIATSASQGTICRQTVRLPRLRPGGSQYFALATSDPNAGKCGEKRQDLETTTVVARYNDEALRGVRTVWSTADTDSVARRLFAPQELTMPAPDVVYVRDNSPELRFFSTSGELLATIARDTSGRDLGTEVETTRLRAAVGSEVPGEIYAAYFKIRRQNDQTEVEQGIGRFRGAEERTRTGTEAVIEPVWTVPAGAGGTTQTNVTRMAYNPVSGELLVMQAEVVPQQRTTNVVVARYSADGRKLDPPWDVPDDGQIDPYLDMSVGPDGRVYLLHMLRGEALVFGPDGSEEPAVPVARDARGIAGGPPEAAGSVFALREHGTIERYADDGTVTARLDGRAVPYSDPTFITDMVVDARGTVYVADGQASLISAFAATDDPLALPVPEDGTCGFVGQKAASPARIRLGEAVTVTLALSGSCGVREEPTDIVVVVPYIGQLMRGRDPSALVIANLLSLAGRVDFAIHRVGIVTYYQTTTVELPLSSDREAYIAKVQDLTRLDAPNADIKPRLKDAMEVANGLFEPAAGRRQVMVLMNAAYCDPNNQRRPVDCTGYPSADETAAAIRAAGTRILAVFGPAAANLASSDEDVVMSFGEAHRRMVDYHLPSALMASLTLVDTVPANMRVVPGSIAGGGTWSAPDVTWQGADLGFGAFGASFRLEPLAAGRWPTNDRAVATIVDGWGTTRTVAFPVPEVEVIGPTPEPSATPEPGTTPAPTATPPPDPTQPSTPSIAYLPWLGNAHCTPKSPRLDLVLVVDASSSMAGDKLEAAKAAMRRVLDAARLSSGDDRVALIAFDGAARVAQALTSDRARLEAGLMAVQPGEGTRIDLGLFAALGALDDAAARGAHPVIVLLSDGRQVEATAEAHAAGDAARARGIEVFTVGLGADADVDLLRALATSDDHALVAPSPDDLQRLYEGILRGLTGCPETAADAITEQR